MSLKVPTVDDAAGSTFSFAELTTGGDLRLTDATLVPFPPPALVVDALPPATADNRGQAYLLQASSADDTLHVSIRLADGTFAMKQIALT